MINNKEVQILYDQVNSFRKQGYLSLDGFIPGDEVERLRKAYDKLIIWWMERETGKSLDMMTIDAELKEKGFLFLENPQSYFFPLRDTLFEENAKKTLLNLVDRDVELQAIHVLYKPSRYGTPTLWHQDVAYLPQDYDNELVTFWMPLQEVTLANGCMHYLPGSHLMGKLPHHPINDDTSKIVMEIDDGWIDVSRAVVCPLSAGGTTIHHMLTAHYTGPNRSSMPRRAIILDYMIL